MKVPAHHSRTTFLQTALAVLFCIASATLLFIATCRPPSVAMGKFPHLVRPAAPTEQLPFAGPLGQLRIIPSLSQKMNILVLGVDSNGKDADRFQGTRSDTMMLVSIDPLARRVGVVSIPRDSRVKLPRHGVDKINSAHAIGGPEFAMETVREAFGVPVEHYIEVDTQGLKRLFEVMGPVQVLVEKEMHYKDHTAKLYVDLKPGWQTLSPEQSEQYVRFRHDARGDLGRIERQQWFIRQAGKKLKDPQIILKLPELVALGYECVRTDIPMQEMLAIAAFARDFPQEKVVTATLPGHAEFISGGSYWIPDMPATQAILARILNCSISTPEPVADVPPETAWADFTERPQAPGLRYDFSKPISICIKYPKDCQRLAELLGERLAQAGFRMKYRWQMPESECQHAQLIQNSVRADDRVTAELCETVPELGEFAPSLAIEQHPVSDLTIVLSAQTSLPSVLSLSPPAPQQHSANLNAPALTNSPLVLPDG